MFQLIKAVAIIVSLTTFAIRANANIIANVFPEWCSADEVSGHYSCRSDKGTVSFMVDVDQLLARIHHYDNEISGHVLVEVDKGSTQHVTLTLGVHHLKFSKDGRVTSTWSGRCEKVNN